MPIFEYHCKQCAAEFEILQRASDTDTSPKCPECGGGEPTKRFSAFATAGTQPQESASDTAT